MADAWGGSFGTAWGISWGGGVVPVEPPKKKISGADPTKNDNLARIQVEINERHRRKLKMRQLRYRLLFLSGP